MKHCEVAKNYTNRDIYHSTHTYTQIKHLGWSPESSFVLTLILYT